MALYIKNDEVIYFDSFDVEYVPTEVIYFTRNNDMETSIFKIQADDS